MPINIIVRGKLTEEQAKKRRESLVKNYRDDHSKLMKKIQMQLNHERT